MDKILCIIPARGGSKRIPRKNIKKFLGKPIISYSIEAAQASGLFSEIMVSTDDDEIAKIAKKFGAKVPFFRSKQNADDFATTIDVLLEVVQEYKDLELSFQYICCIYPTAPFVTRKKLVLAYEKMLADNLDSVFPVMPFSYPIQRSLKLKNNKVQFNYPEYETSRSQDLEKAYHDAGQFYFIKTESLIKKRSLITKNTGGIVINELEAQDIDTETDWKIAELKYELLQNFK